MILTIDAFGIGHALYTEAIDLRAIGSTSIARASHVEPNDDGTWSADMSPVHGPTLGPYPTRSAALTAEVEYLERHIL